MQFSFCFATDQQLIDRATDRMMECVRAYKQCCVLQRGINSESHEPEYKALYQAGVKVITTYNAMVASRTLATDRGLEVLPCPFEENIRQTVAHTKQIARYVRQHAA